MTDVSTINRILNESDKFHWDFPDYDDFIQNIYKYLKNDENHIPIEHLELLNTAKLLQVKKKQLLSKMCFVNHFFLPLL